jgi:hypothetical protein
LIARRIEIVVALDRFDLRERGRVQSNLSDELLDGALVAFHVNQNAAGVIEHLTPERTARGQRIDVRAKPDALHDAPHQYLHACSLRKMFGQNAHEKRPILR